MGHAVAWVGQIECALEDVSDSGEERGDVFVVVLPTRVFWEDKLGDAVPDMHASAMQGVLVVMYASPVRTCVGSSACHGRSLCWKK